MEKKNCKCCNQQGINFLNILAEFKFKEIPKDLGRNQEQRSVDIDPESWGDLSKMNAVFIRRYSSICVQNFRNKEK